MLKRIRSKTWEIEQSSLARNSKSLTVTYEQCRKYACEDITNNLMHIPKDISSILEIPKGTDFHFIGRIDTSISSNIPRGYYKDFERRSFASFSIINNKNISRYEGGLFFIYDINPEDIVHIFPMDSNTYVTAEQEDDLTILPSLWITLEELEKLTLELKVYSQITCNTKRNGKIIKPVAVII